MNPKPKRGEIWLVDMGMVEKVRPALVLSGPSALSDRDLITVIPHTTTLRGSRFEIHIPLPFLKPGAFLAQSPATVPAPRAEKRLGEMTEAQVRQIEDSLLEWLVIRRQGGPGLCVNRGRRPKQFDGRWTGTLKRRPCANGFGSGGRKLRLERKGLSCWRCSLMRS